MIKNHLMNKNANLMFKRAERQAKQDKCLLCGKSCSSFCNSHIIPVFVLKNIADNGYVLLGTFAFDSNEKYDAKVGINKTWTFYVICNDCDKRYFEDYENEKALLNVPTNKMLAEIALKGAMMQIAKRLNEISLHKLYPGMVINNDLLVEEKQLDLRDYFFDFKRLKKIIDKNLKSGLILLFYKLLDYVTPIAMQGPIAIHRDINGELVNDVDNFDPNIRMQQMHLTVLPLSSKTVVMMFHHKDDRNYRKFDREFNKLNEEEKLRYLNYLIIKYCEHYAISPQLKLNILHDKTLDKLAREHFDNSNSTISIEEIVFPKQLVNWRDTPNLLVEEYKLK